jgi:hypothetical protein
MLKKFRYRWLLLALLGAASLQAEARADACAVTAPESWVPRAVRWEGDCADGYADGLGVLKELQGNAVKRIFYGRVKEGTLQSGVIDALDEGYLAGRFENGHLVSSDDRQVYLDAFKTAVAAAQATAQRFQRKGNTASAHFYAGKAKALQQQMD